MLSAYCAPANFPAKPLTLLKLLPAWTNCRRSGGAFVMVNTAVELEVLEEKMPESPWHNKNVEAVKELLEQALSDHPTAVVFVTFSSSSKASDMLLTLQSSFKAHRLWKA
jgi:hypothetical protein